MEKMLVCSVFFFQGTFVFCLEGLFKYASISGHYFLVKFVFLKMSLQVRFKVSRFSVLKAQF